MKILNHIPNTITLFNLLSGTLGILFFGKGELELSVYCIFISGILDFFDGFAARLLNSTSPIGKDLDSLADVVSFGVLPGLLLYEISRLSFVSSGVIPPNVSYLAFLIPMFSALRLAKFNHDNSQSFDFKGLATPANAFFIASLVMAFNANINKNSTQSLILLFAILILPFLLISNVRLFSMKIKEKTVAKNLDRIAFLALSFICIPILGWNSGVVILLLYFLISIFITSRIRPI